MCVTTLSQSGSLMVIYQEIKPVPLLASANGLAESPGSGSGSCWYITSACAPPLPRGSVQYRKGVGIVRPLAPYDVGDIVGFYLEQQRPSLDDSGAAVECASSAATYMRLVETHHNGEEPNRAALFLRLRARLMDFYIPRSHQTKLSRNLPRDRQSPGRPAGAGGVYFLGSFTSPELEKMGRCYGCSVVGHVLCPG